MIDFAEVEKEHYEELKECHKCQSKVWPCEVITILDEFELFIKKVQFHSEVIDSWIKDYPNFCPAKWTLGGCIKRINHKGSHVDPNGHSW
jgi:hypothetical protein